MIFKRQLFQTTVIVLLTFILCPQKSGAQRKIPEDLYLFDGNMKGTDAAHAKYFLSIRKFGDSVWQWDTYNFTGPIIRMETFSDHDGKVRNGYCYYYTVDGDLDSVAQFKHGLRDGTFYHLKSTGTGPHDSIEWKNKYFYENDRLIKTEAVIHNNIADDSTIIESVYPGGIKKWTNYLSKTLEYPERALNERITGLVRALFTVDRAGKIGDIYLARSVEYSLDREVQRVIRKSGDWVPGSKNGVAVKTLKMQPVNLQLR